MRRTRRPLLLSIGVALLFLAACRSSPKGQQPPANTLPATQTVTSAPSGLTIRPATRTATTTPATSSASAAFSSTYTVKQGDTLGGIATSFGTSLQALLTANPGINANAIQVGQQLKVPSSGITPTVLVPPIRPTVLVPPAAPPSTPGTPAAQPIRPCTSDTGGACITECKDGIWSSSIRADACDRHGGAAG